MYKTPCRFLISSSGSFKTLVPSSLVNSRIRRRSVSQILHGSPRLRRTIRSRYTSSTPARLIRSSAVCSSPKNVPAAPLPASFWLFSLSRSGSASATYSAPHSLAAPPFSAKPTKTLPAAFAARRVSCSSERITGYKTPSTRTFRSVFIVSGSPFSLYSLKNKSSAYPSGQISTSPARHTLRQRFQQSWI